jgi:hypothetical protein
MNDTIVSLQVKMTELRQKMAGQQRRGLACRRAAPPQLLEARIEAACFQRTRTHYETAAKLQQDLRQLVEELDALATVQVASVTMRTASDALATALHRVDLPRLERTMDAIAEQLEQSQDIGSALAQPLLGPPDSDMEQVFAEWDTAAASAQQEPAAASVPQKAEGGGFKTPVRMALPG